MSKQLSSEEWGRHYNISMLDNLVRSVRERAFSVQTSEMISITQDGARVLEIGCGTGATSLSLASQGRVVTALDYAEECVQLVRTAALRLELDVPVLQWDAQKELPFSDNEFDVIFHAGLLEHFEHIDRVRLLRLWARAGRRMVSLVPNASSLAYRIGKARMEAAGCWPYGLELPLYTQRQDFAMAGLNVLHEYTIGAYQSLEFLPRWHPLRFIMRYWLEHNGCGDLCGQGYLLVTIGEKS